VNARTRKWDKSLKVRLQKEQIAITTLAARIERAVLSITIKKSIREEVVREPKRRYAIISLRYKN